MLLWFVVLGRPVMIELVIGLSVGTVMWMLMLMLLVVV